MNTALTNFLSGSGTDHAGRTYQDILDQDDQWLDYTHDWVQWCFPLFEKSQSVKNAPTLESSYEVEVIRTCSICQENMRLGLIRYAEFLRDNDHWLRHHDHNHLRITRVIKSTKTLLSHEQASDFHQYVTRRIEAQLDDGPSNISVGYWRRALCPETYD